VDASAVVEVSAVRKSGEEIVVELSLSPIQDTATRGEFMLATIRDVSEQVQMRAQAARRLNELEALYEADETLHRSLRLEDVLQALVNVTHEILQADKTTLVVWDARHERLIPGATRGMRPETVARISFALGDAITGLVALTKQPIAVEQVANDPRVDHRITDPEGICSLLQVPIQIDGEVFGVFGVNYCHDHTFTGAEERLLVALAERAATAIANAREYQHAQYAATLGERQRLARELHDAVTQTLFAAGLNAQALPGIWTSDPEEGQQCVRELQRLIWGALAEMRTVLVELRPAALTEMDLRDLLQQLAQAATARVPSLETVVTVDGERRIPPELQVGLYRIAQEALNNIVKHADARHAEVRLVRRPDGVELSVSDDGRGFDPGSIPAGHLGIGIMRERVQVLGGLLSIDTEPGGGTCLRVACYREQSVPAE
jgi:signal transduction histidine kinase